MPSPTLAAPGPRLSQAAIDRIAGERFRPKAQDDAPGAEPSSNAALLESLPQSSLDALRGSTTAPPPDGPDVESLTGHRYEEDVWPRFVMDGEDQPHVGFPKGVPADVVEKQRENARKQYEDAREAQRKAEEERKAEQEKNAPQGTGGGDDPGDPPDMPNPDSGDPGGPRSLDPFFYRPQEVLIKEIAQVAIR